MFYNLGFLSSCFWTCLLQRAVLFCICPEDSVDSSVSCPRNGAKRAGTKHQGEKEGDKCARRQDELLSPCTFKNGTHCQWEPFQGRAPADGSSCWEPVPGDTAKSNCQVKVSLREAMWWTAGSLQKEVHNRARKDSSWESKVSFTALASWKPGSKNTRRIRDFLPLASPPPALTLVEPN